MIFILLILASLIAAAPNNQSCVVVDRTVTVTQAASTFLYTTTLTVPADNAQVVTKTVEKPEYIDLTTSTLSGIVETVKIVTYTTKYKGVHTTSTSTVTTTTYPNATTSVTEVEKIVVYVEGTLTVTYPPAYWTTSFSRYTGAPTSLWLSVIN